MASDINSVVIVGRIVRDAELRYAGNGTAICNFAIASNRSVKKGEQWTDEASFFDLTLFSKQAEGLNKYLVKGTQVAVKGSLKQDRWEKDGTKQSKMVIHIDDIQLIGGRREGGEAPQDQHEAPMSRDRQEPDPPF